MKNQLLKAFDNLGDGMLSLPLIIIHFNNLGVEFEDELFFVNFSVSYNTHGGSNYCY